MDMQALENTYRHIKESLPVSGITLLIMFIAVLLIANRFITDFKKISDGERDINVKMFFTMYWNYIVVLIVVLCLPAFISVIEKPLALFQNDVIEKYSDGLKMNVQEAMDYYEDQYVKNEGGYTGANLIPVVKQLYNIYTAITESIFIFLLYVSKYLFYMFSSGRYLYLILLEIVAPLAIVLVLNKDTRHYFYSWVKYFIICYMMIPTFLIANTFAELTSHFLFAGGSGTMWDINALGPVGLFMTCALKLYLFSYGQRQLFNLL